MATMHAFEGNVMPIRLLLCALCLALLAACGGSPAGTWQDSGGTRMGAASEPAQYHDVMQRIYIAYFGRPADPGGLAWYSDRMRDAGAPLTVEAMVREYGSNAAMRVQIDQFGTSLESGRLYPGDNASFVTAIYRNLFNRAPDSAGLDYWAGNIDSGRMGRAIAAMAIMAGARDADADIITRKTAVATAFTSSLTTPALLKSYDGDGPAAIVRAMLAQVGNTTTVPSFQPVLDTTLARLLAAAEGLKVVAVLRPSVVDFDSTGLAIPWTVHADHVRFASLPPQLSVGAVFILRQRAYVVEQIVASADGSGVLVVTATPDIRQLFSTLTVSGGMTPESGTFELDPAISRLGRQGGLAPSSCIVLKGEQSCTFEVGSDNATISGKAGFRHLTLSKVDIDIASTSSVVEATGEVFLDAEVAFKPVNGAKELKGEFKLGTLNVPLPGTPLLTLQIPLTLAYTVQANLALTYKIALVSPLAMKQLQLPATPGTGGSVAHTREPTVTPSIAFAPAGPATGAMGMTVSAFAGVKTGIYVAALKDIGLAGIPLRAGVNGEGYFELASLAGTPPCWTLVPEVAAYAAFEVAFAKLGKLTTPEFKVYQFSLPRLESTAKCSSVPPKDCQDAFPVPMRWYKEALDRNSACENGQFPCSGYKEIPTMLSVHNYLAYGDTEDPSGSAIADYGSSPRDKIEALYRSALQGPTARFYHVPKAMAAIQPDKDYKYPGNVTLGAMTQYVQNVEACSDPDSALRGFPHIADVDKCPEELTVPLIDLAKTGGGTAQDWGATYEYRKLPLRRIVKKLIYNNPSAVAANFLADSRFGDHGTGTGVSFSVSLQSLLPPDDSDYTASLSFPIWFQGKYISPVSKEQERMLNEYDAALACYATAVQALDARRRAVACPGCP
jgi:hypothetical protein